MAFILLRKESGVEEVAVKPVTQFPSNLEENAIDRYRKYTGLRQVLLKTMRSKMSSEYFRAR